MTSSDGGSSSGSGSPVPSVIERLGNLRPSKELLEYYRMKLAEYDKDHEVLTGKLDQFKFSFEEQVGLSFILVQLSFFSQLTFILISMCVTWILLAIFVK